MKNIFCFIFCLVILSGNAQIAQITPIRSVDVPSPSPQGYTEQVIGLTTLSVRYGRPSVRGRANIFGGLVPYNQGKPYPWRAGADNNTIISFEHEVSIEGKPMAAGSYGFHIIPSAAEYTLIFSKQIGAWGSFTYRQDEDVLRVQVMPKESSQHQETLLYEFTDLSDSSTVLSLKWANKVIPFRIDVDVKKFTLNNIRTQLRNVNNFSWAGPYSAANWCMQNNYNLEEALRWINQANATNTSFAVVQTKYQILQKLGKGTEADSSFLVNVQNCSYNEGLGYIGGLIQQKYTSFDTIINELLKRFTHKSAAIWLATGNAYRRIRDVSNARLAYEKGITFSADAIVKDQLNKALEELNRSK